MNTFVIDSSIAVKWVIDEEGTREVLALRQRAKLIAPELLVPECANVLWKKVRRSELTDEEALLLARILQAADLELAPMRSLLEPATRLAVARDRPAYDCIYLALAVEHGCTFVTADERFLRKLVRRPVQSLCERILSLTDAAAL